jgi:glutathione peroxidase
MNSLIEGVLWDYALETSSHQPWNWDLYKGSAKAILLVNTASKCGFTPQLEGLEKLYQEFKDKGLVIIGVPSNDFFGQEPLADDEIVNFCQLNYGVTFPLTKKVHVVKKDPIALYQWLGSYAKPKWNFHKYLFDRNGSLVETYLPLTTPSNKQLIEKIKELVE